MQPRSLQMSGRQLFTHQSCECSLQQRRAALRLRLAARQAKLCLRAAEPGKGQGRLASDSLAGAQTVGKEDGFPEYEMEPDQELLPKRQPGNFPSVRPRTTVQRALAVISDNLIPGLAGPEPSADDVVAFDPLRDGPLRYLGYANECGEAFAAWLPIGGVPLSYAIAVAYVLVDTYDKGHMAYLQAGIELDSSSKSHPDLNLPRLVQLLSFERSLDTIVWQLLASVICPGFTIHSVVQIVEYALAKLQESPAVVQAIERGAAVTHQPPDVFLAVVDKSIPTACGLAAIPFIVHPIDNAIHAIMNLTLRPAMRKYVCGSGQGGLAELAMCNGEECRPEL